MRRYLFVIVSALAAVVLITTACAPAAQEATEEPVQEPEIVQLRFVAGGGDDPQGRTWDELTQRFNETVGQEKGIEVTYEKVPAGWQEYTQKIIAQAAAGTPPDVVNLSPLNKVDFLNNDYLLDLKPLMEADNLEMSQWYPPTFDAWKDEEGHIFGFGHGIYTEAIFYNKDLFEEAGLEPPPLDWDNSWSWEEFAEYARTLTKGEGPDKQYGFYVENQLGWMTPIFKSFCGSIGLPDGSRLNMDSEGSVAALEFITDLMWKDGTCPHADVTSATPVGDLFQTGRLAMHWDGSWWNPTYAENVTEFEWGVLPLPSGSCGTWTGYWVDAFSIPATAAHPQESYEFIKFLVGDEASNAYVDNALFGIPGKVSVAEGRANDLFKPLTPEEAKVWLDSANYGTTPEYTPNWNEVWDMTNTVLQRLELGEITAAEAGQLMVEEADRLIEAVQ